MQRRARDEDSSAAWHSQNPARTATLPFPSLAQSSGKLAPSGVVWWSHGGNFQDPQGTPRAGVCAAPCYCSQWALRFRQLGLACGLHATNTEPRLASSLAAPGWALCGQDVVSGR